MDRIHFGVLAQGELDEQQRKADEDTRYEVGH